MAWHAERVVPCAVLKTFSLGRCLRNLLLIRSRNRMTDKHFVKHVFRMKRMITRDEEMVLVLIRNYIVVGDCCGAGVSVLS